MKKMVILILTIMFCVLLAGCGKKATLRIPFDIANVDSVEMYHYTVPGAAEKKIITETGDITEVYTMFSELEVSNKKTEPVTGGEVISFRFHLLDDTSYEIIYCAETVKSGRLKFPIEQFDYYTSADIGGCWNTYEYETVAANESELPSYK